MLKTISRGVIAYLLILIIFFVIAYTIAMTIINNQERIDTTPEFIFYVLEENGYSINNIRITEDDHPGPMYVPEYGMRAELEVNNKSYNLFIVLYDEFYKAQKSSSLINQLDRRMNGGYAYAFNYGSVLVQVCPSDKDVGLKIVELLKEYD